MNVSIYTFMTYFPRKFVYAAFERIYDLCCLDRENPKKYSTICNPLDVLRSSASIALVFYGVRQTYVKYDPAVSVIVINISGFSLRTTTVRTPAVYSGTVVADTQFMHEATLSWSLAIRQIIRLSWSRRDFYTVILPDVITYLSLGCWLTFYFK
ncbi:hypothetical protein EVAR_81064_1 [Eumeta japonica]|uniref:Uncharacterized protein n=1 Tax=Eumeta variegata TaxID=151549 RepID=A0A4C1T5V0_EUMVA|nr:hypothetical protein EVAR_81064_1 [Eumeta japonica]